MRRGLRILGGLSAAVLVGACSWNEVSPQGRSVAWQAVPAGPLSPREGAVGLWTGREVLLIGGSDAPPCPPNAGCLPAKVPPLSDGAAFDPQTKRWRRIADSPVPFDWAEGFVLRGTAYLWVPGSMGRPKAKPAFLAYHIERNRWQELPLPPGDIDLFRGIVQAGDRIVAYTWGDEQGEQPDYIFDRAENTWTELPPEPHSPAFDRVMTWSGRELVLFDHELVPNPGADGPIVGRTAVFDFETDSWRRLPDTTIQTGSPWVAVDGRLVSPDGGIFDPASGKWSELPGGPDGENEFGIGVLTESRGHYFAPSGWVLDVTTQRWIEVPRLGTDDYVQGRTVVSAGRDLFVFGGAVWRENNFEATLLDEAWIWSPSSRG